VAEKETEVQRNFGWTHQEFDTEKKEVSRWSDWYTKILSWSQNHVQPERFPVSVCNKYGILLTRDLSEAKPCEHVAVPMTPSAKPMQTHAKFATFKGSSGFMVSALAVGHPFEI